MAERRNTMQQEVVFRMLQEMKAHPTADILFQEVKKLHPSISRATVFRILNRLWEEGRIAKVHNGNGADGFDFRTDKHCHIRCNMCGRIDDIHMKAYPNLENEVGDTRGYKIIGHYLLFEGICKACEQKKKINET